MSDQEITQSARTYTIKNRLGLHLRPASRLVQIFSEFPDSEILVGVGDTRINGKSIMGLLMLEAAQGTEIIVEVAGPSAEEIFRRVDEVIAMNFEEE